MTKSLKGKTCHTWGEGWCDDTGRQGFRGVVVTFLLLRQNTCHTHLKSAEVYLKDSVHGLLVHGSDGMADGGQNGLASEPPGSRGRREG